MKLRKDILINLVPELKNYTNEKIKNLFSNLGYEVENIEPIIKSQGFGLAQTIEFGKHPNADKLKYGKLDFENKIIGVVCGGKNVDSDQNVFYGPIDSTILGTKLTSKEIRGIVSNGMILSLSEITGFDKTLFIEEEQKNIISLPKSIKNFDEGINYLGIGSDTIDLTILPNRNYAKNYFILAAEISALYNLKLSFSSFNFIDKISAYNDSFEKKHNLKNTSYIAFSSSVDSFKLSEQDKTILYINNIKVQNKIDDLLKLIELLTGANIEIKQIDNSFIAVFINQSFFVKNSFLLIAKLLYENDKNINFISSNIFESKNKMNIKLNKENLEKFIGQKINFEQIHKKLELLGFQFEETNETIDVLVPTYRNDLTQEQKVYEEYVRFLGIENIYEENPNFELNKSVDFKNKILIQKQKIATLLTEYNLNEVKTYKLLKNKEAKEFNVFSSHNFISLKDNEYDNEANTLRTSLITNLIKVYKYNYRKEKFNDLNFFEIGKIFVNNDELESLALIHDENFYKEILVENSLKKTKFILEEILKLTYNDIVFKMIESENNRNIFSYNSAEIHYKNKLIGVIGEIHQNILRENKFIRIDKVKTKLFYLEIIINYLD